MGESNKPDVDITYHSVSDMDTSYRPKIELGNHPQLSQKRGIITTFVVQIFALLWLVPIVALLYLNFSGYTIGATAWCPGGHCWVELFNPVSSIPQQRLVKFSQEDHNLLGGLQLVAKALEVWFVFISAAFVYIITMHFAAKSDGLPIGYLTRPIEFADPVTLFDPLLYKTGPHPWGKRISNDKALGRRVWFLIALSVGLCILCNLMGPATAVLVIPSLQWLSTEKIGERQFASLNSAEPPKLDETAWFWWWTRSCSNAQLQNQQYTCVYDPFGQALDLWAATSLGAGVALSAQEGLSFQGNSTGEITGRNAQDAYVSDLLFWAPSRQIISNLSTDAAVVSAVSRGYTNDEIQDVSDYQGWNNDPIDTYTEYNKSRELEITRNGPIAGAVINMWSNFNESSSLFTVEVDAHRQIRCYKDYDLYYTPGAFGTSSGIYTKCMQVGTGWGSGNKQAKFYVNGQYDKNEPDKVTAGVDVNVYSSEKVVYFPNGTLPSWLPQACLSDSARLNTTHCDWERLWTVDPESPMVNRSTNLNTIEYVMFVGNVSVDFVVDFAPILAFTNYSFDPSPFTNPTQFVKTSDLPNWGTSVHVDPAWILAAWATDKDGQLQTNRTMTTLLVEQMHVLFNNQTSGLDNANPYFPQTSTNIPLNNLALLPVFQTLSLIDFSTKISSGSGLKADMDHPLLQRHAKMNVWAYKMGSRTSYMGAAVGILGCVVVIAQVVLGFVDRRRYRSPTQLLVAALEHAPRGEFEGKNHDEVAMAAVRFHIQDDGNHTGKFSFYEPVGVPVSDDEMRTVR